MTPSLLPITVPAPARIVNPATTERRAYCVECGRECSPYAVRAFYGRELCRPCYEAEEAACFEMQAAAWEELEFAQHERMASLKSVLQGMGF